MTEPTEQTEAPAAETPQAQPPAEAPSAAPPWGDDFDPDRAWRAIQSSRQAEREAKARARELEPLAQEAQRLREISKTDLERLTERAEAAEREREQHRADAIRYRTAATFGLQEDDFDLLGSGTEDEIVARAQKIAAKNAAALGTSQPPPASRRPTEQLRPGATPSASLSEDDLLYQSIYGNPK